MASIDVKKTKKKISSIEKKIEELRDLKYNLEKSLREERYNELESNFQKKYCNKILHIVLKYRNCEEHFIGVFNEVEGIGSITIKNAVAYTYNFDKKDYEYFRAEPIFGVSCNIEKEDEDSCIEILTKENAEKLINNALNSYKDNFDMKYSKIEDKILKNLNLMEYIP